MKHKSALENIIQDFIDKMEGQHQEVDRRLDNIEKVMLAQEINLKEHMRRSDNLETLISVIQTTELKPLQKHVNMIEGVFKFLGLISLVVGIIGGVLRLFNVI